MNNLQLGNLQQDSKFPVVVSLKNALPVAVLVLFFHTRHNLISASKIAIPHWHYEA